MEAIETFEHAGFTVKLCHDPDASSPLECDNFATLACWHRRAKLGDRQIAGCSGKDLVRDVKGSGERIVAILPLYLYEHGGMTMRCGAFADPWDSGQVGWGYVTASQAEEMGCKPGSKRGDGGTYDKAYFEGIIRAEVAVYDDYLTGRCYGYVVCDEDGDELDSCWGFVGDLDYVRTEAKQAAESARPLGKVDGGCDARCES